MRGSAYIRPVKLSTGPAAGHRRTQPAGGKDRDVRIAVRPGAIGCTGVDEIGEGCVLPAGPRSV